MSSPQVRLFESFASRSSTSFVSSRSFSSSEILSSPITVSESAQSTALDTEIGETFSREDALARNLASGPAATRDGCVPAILKIPLSHADERGECLKSERGDRMLENVDLDASLLQDQSIEQSRSSTPDSILSEGMNPEETSIPQLDDLLQLDAREFTGDTGMAFVDSLFPNSECEDIFPLESVGDWAFDCFPELPSLHAFSEIPEVQNDEFAGRDASHQWLQNCLRRFSLSDLRKVKLKRSTIESATKRLGGGKKGMLCFLKVVLMWLLAQSAKRLHSVSSVSIGLPSRESDTCAANEHADGSIASVEDKLVRGSNKTLTLQFLQDGKQDQGLSPSALGRNDDDRSATFVENSPQSTYVSHPATMQDSLDRLSGSRSLYTHSFPYPIAPMENQWSSLHSVNETKYQWPARDGDGGAPTLSTGNDFPVNSFPCRLPQAMNGETQPMNRESEWHGYCESSLQTRNLQSSSGGVVTSSFGGYAPTTSDSLGMTTNSSAATTRAARMSRMERRKWSIRRQQRWPAKLPLGNLAWPYPISEVSLTSNTSSSPRSCQRLGRSSSEIQQVKKFERNLKLLFQKELKQSDVGNLGRIVVPKKAAETSLPSIDFRDGVTLVVEDLNSSKVWSMRYRFWPNNKSRMYLLENTGDFIKSYDLREGDYMVLYINMANNKYMIRGDKAKAANAAPVPDNAYSDLHISNGYGVRSSYRTEGPLTKKVGSYYMDQPNRHPIRQASTSGSKEAFGGPEVELDDSFIAELESSLEGIDDAGKRELSKP